MEVEDAGDKQVGSGCVLKLEPTGVQAVHSVWALRKPGVLRPPPGFGPQIREDGAAVRGGGGAGGAGFGRRPRAQFWNCLFGGLLGGACGHW